MDILYDDSTRRTATEEEEADAEGHARRYAQPALTMLSRYALKKHPDGVFPVDMLILGVNNASHAILHGISSMSPVIGSVVHPAISPAGMSVNQQSYCESSRAGSILRLAEVSGGTAVVGRFQSDIPPEVSVATVRGLLSIVKPSCIVTVSDIQAQSVLNVSDDERQDFYVLPNTHTRTQIESSSLQKLPDGCLLTGIVAATMSAAEARGIPAAALLSVGHEAFPALSKSHVGHMCRHLSRVLSNYRPACEIKVDINAVIHGLTAPKAPRVYL